MRRTWAVLVCMALGSYAGDDVALREFLGDRNYADGWIYEDIDTAYARAEKSGKPLLACFCCVP